MPPKQTMRFSYGLLFLLAVVGFAAVCVKVFLTLGWDGITLFILTPVSIVAVLVVGILWVIGFVKFASQPRKFRVLSLLVLVAGGVLFSMAADRSADAAMGIWTNPDVEGPKGAVYFAAALFLALFALVLWRSARHPGT